MTKTSVVNKQNQALKKNLERALGTESEGSFLRFFSQYGPKILIALSLVAVAAFFAVRSFNRKESSSFKEYYQARTAYTKLVQETNIEGSLIAQMQQLIKKHPEMAPQYEGLLAQTLINQGDSSTLSTYTAPLFKRMDNTLSPVFKEYAAISVLVAEKKYDEALERTQKLDKELTEINNTFYLPLFNLLRQAALAEQLDNKELELKTWEEWSLRTTAEETQVLMKDLFQEGVVSLSDYIKYRLKTLQQR